MNILIRVDASATIGSGHVMRCLTLACALKERGLRVVFLMRELDGHRFNEVEAKGFNVILLKNSDKNDMVCWKSDAIQTIEIISKLTFLLDWIIVDHYALDARWEEQLQAYTKKMMVIDDLADRPHCCDMLLDQNVHLNMEKRYQHLLSRETELLLGPTYALLRKEFLQYRNQRKEYAGVIKKILVFFGGGDNVQLTIKTVDILLKLYGKDIEISVIGKAYSEKNEIEKFCTPFNNVNYFSQVSNIAELMLDADLSIGAGGSTTWERCCMGLPSLVISVADNQVEISKTVDQMGAIKYLGDANHLTTEIFSGHISNIMNDSSTLKKISSKAHQLVDGMGCERVAERFLSV